ncbi:MAG: D-2-hydroxyacid dehydrogenase [Bacteroidota bacterium]
MKIVILDAATIQGKDLAWTEMAQMGELTVFQQSPEAEIAARAAGATALLTNKAPIPRSLIESLPELGYIGVLATGYNTVDLEAARDSGIPVTNVPAYGSEAVAQHAFALILNHANRLSLHLQGTRNGEWARQKQWTYTQKPMQELLGKTLGIIGLGNIGQKTAALGLAFGMQVIAHNRSPREMAGIEMVSLDTVFEKSDFLSLHCPLTAENHAFVNQARLRQMKPTAMLINTARGPLVDEDALLAALTSGEIEAAGLDVMVKEPADSDHPLLHVPNCYITPHNAWGARETRQRLMDIATENLRSWQTGKPVNVVNGL